MSNLNPSPLSKLPTKQEVETRIAELDAEKKRLRALLKVIEGKLDEETTAAK